MITAIIATLMIVLVVISIHKKNYQEAILYMIVVFMLVFEYHINRLIDALNNLR